MNCVKLSSDQQHRRRLVAVDTHDSCPAPGGHASIDLLGNVADTPWVVVEVHIVGDALHAEKQGLAACVHQEGNLGIHQAVV